jgi:uncharacterized protein
MQRKNLIINCPKCKTSFNFYTSQARPFCSDRCKQVDLGQWLNEEYSVATNEIVDFTLDSTIESAEESNGDFNWQ